MIGGWKRASVYRWQHSAGFAKIQIYRINHPLRNLSPSSLAATATTTPPPLLLLRAAGVATKRAARRLPLHTHTRRAVHGVCT